MEATSMRPRPRDADFTGRIEWDAVVTWVLCFGLVAFLGFKGGGYDPLVHDQVGIGIWWVLLVGVLVGALPRLGPSRPALIALGMLTAFVAWMALSLIWTESTERTAADLARALTYLGVFALALSVKAPRERRRLISAVAAAIVLLGLLGLLSRLHPAWFPGADETARFLADSRERLSYPINYWNGLGALLAIGMPLLLYLATEARTYATRALAAAAMPALALTIFLTLSRGGIGAAALGVAAYVAVADDRVPKLATLAPAALGGALLVALAAEREELRHGLTNAVAHDQGNELLLYGLVICGLVALAQVGITRFFGEGRRPGWTVPRRNLSLVVVGGLVALLIVGAIAADGPGRVSNAVDEFKGGGNAGTGTSRLNSFAGESRYALWRSAIDENASAPLLGTGSGTFEYWWTRDAAGTEAVQDAHSLYLQTLGELGVVGLALLAGFMLLILGAGTRAALAAESRQRAQLAAALAGCLAFFLAAAIDWPWQIPVLPAAALLLGSTLVMAGPPSAGVEARARRLWVRVPLALGALAAIFATAVPLAATSLIRDSQSAVRAGDLDAALADARSAENVQPGAATPRLQQALVLEIQGDLAAAAAAARAATERESTNWRTWLVLSRVEAERGRVAPAVDAYREAKSLNPLSPLFERNEDE